MFIHEVNNNILNSGVLFWGGYHDEYEKLDFYQDINIFFGLEWNQKTAETAVARHWWNNNNKNSSWNFWNGAKFHGSIAFKIFKKLDRLMCIRKMGLFFVLLCLLVTMCIVSPGTSHKSFIFISKEQKIQHALKCWAGQITFLDM